MQSAFVWRSTWDARMWAVLVRGKDGSIAENFTATVDDFGNLVPVIDWTKKPMQHETRNV